MTVSVPNIPAYRMGRSVSAPAFFKSTKVCAQRKAKLRAMRDIPTDPIKNDSAMYQRELLELNAYHANHDTDTAKDAWATRASRDEITTMIRRLRCATATASRANPSAGTATSERCYHRVGCNEIRLVHT